MEAMRELLNTIRPVAPPVDDEPQDFEPPEDDEWDWPVSDLFFNYICFVSILNYSNHFGTGNRDCWKIFLNLKAGAWLC